MNETAVENRMTRNSARIKPAAPTFGAMFVKPFPFRMGLGPMHTFRRKRASFLSVVAPVLCFANVAAEFELTSSGASPHRPCISRVTIVSVAIVALSVSLLQL
jgi:hypothetical protein